MQTQNCTPANITITPIQPTPTSGPWQFEYPTGHSYNVKSNFPVIDLPKDSGCWSINLTIGGSNNSLTFSPNNPILINGVPPVLGDQIGPPSSPGPYGKRLSVTDQNSNDAGQGPVLFTYTLNFTGGDQAHRTLDPVIKNGGKSTHQVLTPHASAIEVATFVITIAILITLLFVAYELRLIRRELARR